MVDTTNYDKLKNLLDMPRQPLGAEDMTENTQVGEAHSKVDSAHSNAQAFISDETVGTSQTRAGANSWMSSYIGDVNKHLGKIKSTKVHNLTVRESMHTQAEKGRELSPVLLSESDIAESKRTPPLTLTSDDGKVVEYVTPEAYLTALEEQKNAKREAAAKEILAQIDKEAYAEKNSIFFPMEDYVPGPWQPQPDPGPTPPAPSPAYSGGSRGLVPTVRSGTGAGGGEWTSPAPGELGSASNPISDPADLARYDLTTTPVNQRMTPNGPVGGHMPADVLNVNDPAWRPVPSSGGGARIAGGVLVAGSAAGAAGAALSYGGGFAGIGGLASGASGSALRAVAPAGGVLRPSALPGGGVAGAVGGAGRGGGVGTVGGRGATGGVAGRGGVSAAGRGTSGVGAVGRGGVAPVGSGASGTAGGRGASGGVAGRGGVSAAGRGASGVGAVGRGGVAPVGSGGAGSAGGRGATGGVAGRGGVSAAGRGASGVTTVGRGGVSAAGRGASGVGAVGRGGVAPVGSGGVGDRREKKGQVRRRAYDVVRVDALEERGAQMMGGAAGSADQLKPIARDADADW